MKKEDIIKKNLLWIVAFILIILVWIGLAPEWYSWYQGSWIQEPLHQENEKNKLWMQSLYELLNGRWLVNIPICIALGYFSFLWSRRIAKDNDIRLYRPMLAIMGLVLLFVRCQVDYAKVVCEFDYRVFLAILLGLILLAMAIKLWRPNILKDAFDWIERSYSRIINNILDICKKKKPYDIEEKKDEETGFPTDSVDNEAIPESLKQYASIIVNKLLATKIDEQSFAVGITGGWGVGKTKFLDALKEQMEGFAEVVEFNPWMCRTPEQVTQDFFSSLRHQLSQKYSTLSKSIREYAKLIGNLPIAPHSIFSFDMTLPMGKDSLFEKKQNLSMKFSSLHRPVVVFIDDMDRLEKDEIFEVLRLIRNTADLINTIYIAAYDREYVTTVLKEKNIKDSSSYLEKIFPVEIHLPKVEDTLIWNALIQDFVKQDTKYSGRFARTLINQFNNDQRELILRVLNNYRLVKRFARLYMLNFSYLNKLYPNEIDLFDLFWLELLQIYDQKSYDKLANDPNCLLYYDVNKERYIIRKGILWKTTDNDPSTYTGPIIWNKDTPNLLEQMFGLSFVSKKKRKSISMTENYEKYFTMSVSPFRLSIKEMNELFSEGANPEEVVNRWLHEKKYIDSITYQMKQIDVNGLNEIQLNAFLQGLLSYGERITSYGNHYFLSVRMILQKKRYSQDAEKKAHYTVLHWIERNIIEEKTVLSLSKFLSMLYLHRDYDGNGQEIKISPLVISNEEVKDSLIKVMKSYLNQHPDLTALDIMREDGELSQLFKNCCVLEEDATYVKGYCTHIQVAFNTVIEHFASKVTKPTLKEFEQAYDAMFHPETPVFDSSWEEEDYWPDISDSCDYKRDAYFGSTCNKDLEVFKSNCFIKE